MHVQIASVACLHVLHVQIAVVKWQIESHGRHLRTMAEFDEEGDIVLSQVQENELQFEFDDGEDFKLSASQETTRFGEPVSEQFIQTLQETRIPRNTRRNTRWCVNVYDS